MKMKKILATGLILAALLVTGCGSNGGNTSDVNAQPESGDNTTSVVGETDTSVEQKADSNVNVVLEFGDGKTDTNTAKVGNYHLEGGDFIDTIEISDGLVIDGYTIDGLQVPFAYKSNVRKVVINNSLITEVPSECFRGNTSIEEVELSNITTIGKDAFSECTSLKKVVISEGLVEIGSPCFFSAESLEEVHLPASLNMDVESLAKVFNYHVAYKKPLTIYAPTGSAAEAFGNAYDFITVVNE